MFIRKRHRDKMLHFHEKNKKNNKVESNINTISYPQEEIDNVSKVKKQVMEIPGFYFDYEKDRYFPLKNPHMQTFSEHTKRVNNEVIKSKQHKHERGVKKSVNKQIDDALSVYYLKTHSYGFNKNQIIGNLNMKAAKTEYLKRKIGIYELKKKAYMTKYELMRIDGLYYLISFDTIENSNNLYIERLAQEEGDIDLQNLRHVTVKYGDFIFKNLKVINNLIALVKGYELFFIPIQEILNLKKAKVFHINLNDRFKLKKYPITFNWPIIKQITNDDYIILFNRCIVFTTIRYQSEPYGSYDTNYWDISINLETFLQNNEVTELGVKRSLFFPHNTFTEVLCLNDYIYLGDSSGDIYIYNTNFNHIDTISGSSKVSSPVVNLWPFQGYIIVLRSNSEVEMLKSKKVIKVKETYLPNSFRNDLCSFSSENLLGFINEEGNYCVYDVEMGKEIKKFFKVDNFLILGN
jgi:hypothetical protein